MKAKAKSIKIANCGDCYNWMKKPDCPREVRGLKPSCGSPTCNNFIVENWVKERCEKENIELKILK